MPPPVVGPATAVALSAITYCKDPQTALNAHLPGWTIAWNGNVTVDGNYAFIATDTYQFNQVLCIRGSLPPWHIFTNWDTFANWIIEDLNALFTHSWPYSYEPGAGVSRGVWDGFRNLASMTDKNGVDIYSYLKNAVTNNKPITITGHSLGGNLANVFASYLPWALHNNDQLVGTISLYTFAAPAAGNKVFADDLDAKIPQSWHYEIIEDIIPKFPVFMELEALCLLFPPKPDAGKIGFNYKGIDITLREGIIMLAFAFYEQGYRQASNNYTLLNNELSKDFDKNTLYDWLQQAGFQHSVDNYCKLLGVKPIDCNKVGLLPNGGQAIRTVLDEG